MGIIEGFLRLLGYEIASGPQGPARKAGYFRCPLCDALTKLPGISGWMLKPPVVEASFSGTGGLGVTCCSSPVCENCVEKAKEIDAMHKAMIPAARKAAGLIEE